MDEKNPELLCGKRYIQKMKLPSVNAWNVKSQIGAICCSSEEVQDDGKHHYSFVHVCGCFAEQELYSVRSM